MTALKFITLLLLAGLCSCKQTNEQLLQKADKLISQKKYERAIEIYSKVIERNRKLQAAHYNRGYAYLETKQYYKALLDFNTVMDLQSHDGFIITFNQNAPFADEESRAQIPYNDALYLRAQTKYLMDSLKSAFIDFQMLIDNNYEETSNCMLWQGTIYIRFGKSDKACHYFTKAKMIAPTADDRNEAEKMIKAYCQN